MGNPRKKWHQFTLADKKIPLRLWNDLLRTVEGLDSGPVLPGYSSRELTAPALSPHTTIRYVEIEDTTASVRSSGYQDFPATILYFDPDDETWTKTSPAVPATLLADENQKLALSTGQQVAAYFHRQADVFVPLIGGSSGSLVVRFELTENLDFGGNATAKRLEWGGSSYAVNDDLTFEVYDPFSKFTQSQTPTGQGGARGYAQFFADSDRWEIQQMEHQARWIKFAVDDGTGFSTSDSFVAVDTITYFDGYAPDTDVTRVENLDADSGFVFSGVDDDRGSADYDPATDEYTIKQIECP